MRGLCCSPSSPGRGRAMGEEGRGDEGSGASNPCPLKRFSPYGHSWISPSLLSGSPLGAPFFSLPGFFPAPRGGRVFLPRSGPMSTMPAKLSWSATAGLPARGRDSPRLGARTRQRPESTHPILPGLHPPHRGVLESNYALLHCSPERLLDIWSKVRKVSQLIRRQLSPLLDVPPTSRSWRRHG